MDQSFSNKYQTEKLNACLQLRAITIQVGGRIMLSRRQQQGFVGPVL
jgi:hypothetical protein